MNRLNGREEDDDKRYFLCSVQQTIKNTAPVSLDGKAKVLIHTCFRPQENSKYAGLDCLIYVELLVGGVADSS